MTTPSLRIFVLIDALGWEYVQQTGFLADLLPYRTSLRTVLGFSSGAIPSILTGLAPAQHGLWNLFYYDPEGSPFRWLRPFRVLPDRVMNHRITRKLVKEVARRAFGLGLFECCVSPKLLPWFNWAEPKNIYLPGNIAAGSIFDELSANHVPHRVYSYHDGSDAELLRRAKIDARDSGVRFLFVYLSELDAFLHHHCGDRAAIESRLEWYAAEVRDLLREARQSDPSASLSVFSDHGMTQVTAHIDLASEVERLGFRMPEDYLAVYDATMARFWFFSETARQEITATLNNVFCGKVLLDEERASLGIRFPDQRYGQMIFLLNPGYLITSSGFHRKLYLPSGMHGYHPDDRDSDACFISTDPPPARLAGIQDICGVMRHAAA